MNPYISGFLTAIVYCTTSHLLPKKLTGWKRFTISFVVTVAICCLIRFTFDWFTNNQNKFIKIYL